jgi:hypothetical protein
MYPRRKKFFSPYQKAFYFSRSGTTADGSSHSEAGGGAVAAQVQAADPGA